MTLYDLLKIAIDYHDAHEVEDIDFASLGKRPPSPMTFILGKVNSFLPKQFHCPMSYFEWEVRGVFATDFSNRIYAAAGLSNIKETTAHVCSSIEYPGRVEAVRIQKEAHMVDPLREQLKQPISNGHIYRILADLYPKFPEFCDTCFPLEAPHVA